MKKRLVSACMGLAAGFILGALLWLLDFYAANGADHLFGLVVGLTLGCGIMAFLFPVSGGGGFLVAALKGILGEGGVFPDPFERRGKHRD